MAILLAVENDALWAKEVVGMRPMYRDLQAAVFAGGNGVLAHGASLMSYARMQAVEHQTYGVAVAGMSCVDQKLLDDCYCIQTKVLDKQALVLVGTFGNLEVKSL